MKPIKCPHCKKDIQEWFTVTAQMPEDTRGIVDEAIGELVREGLDLHGSKRVAMGQVVEALAASYVAGQRDHVRALEQARRDP